MSPALKSVATIDFVVIAAYMARVVLACTAVILAAAPGSAGVAARLGSRPTARRSSATSARTR